MRFAQVMPDRPDDLLVVGSPFEVISRAGGGRSGSQPRLARLSETYVEEENVMQQAEREGRDVIVVGPLAMDFVVGLLGKPKPFVVVMDGESAEVEVAIRITEIRCDRDGDGDGYFFVGAAETPVQGYYSTRTNSGWLKRSTR
jgi:hypothetical protein